MRARAPIATLVGYPGGANALNRSDLNLAQAFIEMRTSRSYQRIEPHPPVLTIEQMPLLTTLVTPHLPTGTLSPL
jgi:hypothetical protein